MLPGCSPSVSSSSTFIFNERHITGFSSIMDWEILALNKHHGEPHRPHATMHMMLSELNVLMSQAHHLSSSTRGHGCWCFFTLELRENIFIFHETGCWSSQQRSGPIRGDDSSLTTADFIRNMMTSHKQLLPVFSGCCKVTAWQRWCYSTFSLCLVSEQETSTNHNVDITSWGCFTLKALHG